MDAAKKEAISIYDSMKGFRVTNKHRKKCSKVCCKKLIEHSSAGISTIGVGRNGMSDKEFWEEVLKEIELL